MPFLSSYPFFFFWSTQVTWDLSSLTSGWTCAPGMQSGYRVLTIGLPEMPQFLSFLYFIIFELTLHLGNSPLRIGRFSSLLAFLYASFFPPVHWKKYPCLNFIHYFFYTPLYPFGLFILLYFSNLIFSTLWVVS